MIDPGQPVDFLAGPSAPDLVRLFWFTLVFDIPCYAWAMLTLGLAALPADRRRARREGVASFPPHSVSVVIVGHTEAAALERCVRSLREQSRPPHEIVVISDGANDLMRGAAARLLRNGVVAHALATDLSAGTAAATNLAIGACGGDIVVMLDVGCSLDRFAMEALAAPFADPRVGGVAAGLVPRNGAASLTARMQMIEGLMPMSATNRMIGGLGRMVCLSGACGAFRRTALARVGGMNAGGGEDLDVTLRLRLAGWRVVAVADVLCDIDVPAQPWALLRQLLHRERDAVRVRFCRHARLLNPFAPGIPVRERLHQLDALVFGVIGTVAFPIYLLGLVAHQGRMAIAVLLVMLGALLVMDLVILALASLVVPGSARMTDMLYLPACSFHAGLVMRGVRLAALCQEWVLFSFARDHDGPVRAPGGLKMGKR